MKRMIQLLISLTLCFAMIPNMFVNAQNEEFISVSLEQFLKNEDISIMDLNYKKIELSDGIFYTYSTADTIYVFDKYKKMIMYSEYEALGESKLIKSTTNIVKKSNYVNYDVWGTNEYNTSIYQYTVHFSGSSVIGALTSTLVSILSGGGFAITSTVAGLLAGQIWDDVNNNDKKYVKMTYKYNLYCGILRDEKLSDVNQSGIANVSTQYVAHWLDNPNDYSYPAACRYLTSTYPY